MQQTQTEGELKDDLEHSESLIKELEASLEAAKLSRELELRTSNDSLAVNQLQQKISDLEEDSARLRVKYENLEKKTRRMSDFAATNRMQAQQQVNEMSDRLSQLSKEKDETDAQNSQLMLDNSELSRSIESFKLEVGELVASRDVLSSAKVRMEQDLLRAESTIRKLETALDEITQQNESSKVEVQDLQGELDFARSSKAELEQKIDILNEEAKYSDRSLRVKSHICIYM